jgi:hypothetical protein
MWPANLRYPQNGKICASQALTAIETISAHNGGYARGVRVASRVRSAIGVSGAAVRAR